MTSVRLTQFRLRLAVLSALSRHAAVICWLIVAALPAAAHEIRVAIADVAVSSDQVTLRIQLALEPLVAGIDLRTLSNTDDAPEADRYDRLRALPPAELEAQLRTAWPELRRGITLQAGGSPLVPHIDSVEILDPGDLDLPRDTVLILSADLPPGDSPVTVAWQTENGPLVLRQSDAGEDAYAAFLENGTASAPLPRQGYAAAAAGTVLARFIGLGFVQVIPKGADHILFMLGLFFFALQLRPLLVQVAAFSLASTAALALVALNVVSVSTTIIGPLIAASITVVAVDNVLRPKPGLWRTAVVFGFGLLHGLGLAGALAELGGGQANVLARLVGFVIGVEIGLLTVIAVAWLTLGLWFGAKPWYRRAIATPASLMIAAIGVWWFIERVAA